MRISVAIAAYNAAEYLREAIESVLGQTLQPLEIVVVDDGSTDHTRQVCTAFGPRVRYFFRENDGTAGIGARNRSIAESQGEWIALLDHDDRWMPAKLERQAEALRSTPSAGVVFTRYTTIDADGRDFEPEARPQVTGRIIHFDPHEAFHHLLRSNPYCPSSALIERRLLQRAGRPRHTECGDWSDWFRLTRETPMIVVDDYLTEYRTTLEHFCADKDQLAKRMYETLWDQRGRLYPGCSECKEAFSAGEAHVAGIFSVAARSYLDQYHAAVQAGDVTRALRLLKGAMRASPMEVLRPRRFAAVSKNYMLGAIKTLRGKGG